MYTFVKGWGEGRPMDVAINDVLLKAGSTLEAYQDNKGMCWNGRGELCRKLGLLRVLPHSCLERHGVSRAMLSQTNPSEWSELIDNKIEGGGRVYTMALREDMMRLMEDLLSTPAPSDNNIPEELIQLTQSYYDFKQEDTGISQVSEQPSKTEGVGKEAAQVEKGNRGKGAATLAEAVERIIAARAAKDDRGNTAATMAEAKAVAAKAKAASAAAEKARAAAEVGKKIARNVEQMKEDEAKYVAVIQSTLQNNNPNPNFPVRLVAPSDTSKYPSGRGGSRMYESKGYKIEGKTVIVFWGKVYYILPTSTSASAHEEKYTPSIVLPFLKNLTPDVIIDRLHKHAIHGEKDVATLLSDIDLALKQSSNEAETEQVLSRLIFHKFFDNVIKPLEDDFLCHIDGHDLTRVLDSRLETVKDGSRKTRTGSFTEIRELINRNRRLCADQLKICTKLAPKCDEVRACLHELGENELQRLVNLMDELVGLNEEKTELDRKMQGVQQKIRALADTYTAINDLRVGFNDFAIAMRDFEMEKLADKRRELNSTKPKPDDDKYSEQDRKELATEKRYRLVGVNPYRPSGEAAGTECVPEKLEKLMGVLDKVRDSDNFLRDESYQEPVTKYARSLFERRPGALHYYLKERGQLLEAPKNKAQSVAKSSGEKPNEKRKGRGLTPKKQALQLIEFVNAWLVLDWINGGKKKSLEMFDASAPWVQHMLKYIEETDARVDPVIPLPTPEKLVEVVEGGNDTYFAETRAVFALFKKAHDDGACATRRCVAKAAK